MFSDQIECQFHEFVLEQIFFQVLTTLTVEKQESLLISLYLGCVSIAFTTRLAIALKSIYR